MNMKKRHYIFSKEKSDLKLIATTKAIEAINKYGSFDIPSKIIKDRINSEKILVDLISEQYTENSIIYTFLVEDGKNKIIVKINGDIISFQFGHVYEEFITCWTMNGYSADLIKQEDIYDDRKVIITYPFIDQYMEIEIIFNDKKIVFKTKYDVNNIYDTLMLRFLNSKSSIAELKEYYKKNFYVVQNEWERKCETSISIYEKKNVEFLLSDEIIVENGVITKYTINSMQNGIIIRVKGGKNLNQVITIENYDPINNINIKEQIDNLIIKGRSLK